MTDPELRFVLTPSALADRHAGIEWEPRPGASPVTWSEAVTSAARDGWRLPSTGELIGFLSEVPSGWAPPIGAIFWSGNGSPFARASLVRAVSCESGGRLVVVLLDKSERAHRWGVRQRPTGG